MKVTLQVLRDSGAGPVWEVPPGPTRVGRAPDNDLVVPVADVSSYHLVLTNDADGVVARDLGSTNGTFLNEQRLEVPRPLADGDLLRIGLSTRARVRVAPAADEPSTPDGWLIHQNTGRSLDVRGEVLLEALVTELSAETLSELGEHDEALGGQRLRLATDEVVLTGGSEPRAVPLGEAFAVGPHRFVRHRRKPGGRPHAERSRLALAAQGRHRWPGGLYR